MKRGGFVLVDFEAGERQNKIEGEIVNVVREEKEWRKRAYWYVDLEILWGTFGGGWLIGCRPKEFVKRVVEEDEDEEESTVGKMPPSDSEDER